VAGFGCFTHKRLKCRSRELFVRYFTHKRLKCRSRELFVRLVQKRKLSFFKSHLCCINVVQTEMSFSGRTRILSKQLLFSQVSF